MFDFLKHIFRVKQISRYEQKEIDRLFAQYFSTEEGQNILAYLQLLVCHKSYGVNASDEQLRYAEGQRGLLAQITRMIERGRHGI